MRANGSRQALRLRIADSGASLQDPPPGGAETLDLSRIRSGFRRQRLAILLPVLVFAVLGIAYLLTTPKYYDAYSTLLLDANMNRNVQQVGGIDSGVLSDDTIENARVVIRSNTLAGDVVDVLALSDDPAFVNTPTSGMAQLKAAIKAPLLLLRDRLKALLPGVSPADPAPAAAGSAAEEARLKAVDGLQSGVEVDRLGRSAAVLIRFRSHDPELAARIASTYADSYVADMLKANLKATDQTTEWMRTRLDELQASAQQAADRAEEFRVANGLISSEGALLSEDTVGELNASLSSAIGDAARARATLETYDAAVARGPEALVAGEVPAIGSDASAALTEMTTALNNARARLDRLVAAYGPDHPQVRGSRQTLASTADRLFLEMQGARAGAQTAVQAAEARIAAMQSSLTAAVSESTAKGGAQVELRALERRSETLSNLYQSMLMRSQEVEQQSSFPVTNVRVLSYAEIPEDAAGPSLLRVLGGAILLGLILGIAWAVRREGADRALRTGADVAAEVRMPFLGYLPPLPRVSSGRHGAARAVEPPGPVPTTGRQTLPMLRRDAMPVAHVALPALHYRRSIYSETLRRVRLALEAAAADDTVPAIGVTSIHPDPARAMVALNLAGILAGNGFSVLVVDADLRERALSRLIGIEDRHGLADAMMGRGDWRDMTVSIALTRVVALSCGLAGADSGGTEVLTTSGMHGFLDEAREEFDCIIVDAAPLYPVVEGRAALNALDKFLLVAEWGKVPRGVLQDTVASDPALMQRCLGIVFDRVNLRRLRRRYLEPGAADQLMTANSSYLDGRRQG